MEWAGAVFVAAIVVLTIVAALIQHHNEKGNDRG